MGIEYLSLMNDMLLVGGQMLVDQSSPLVVCCILS